MAGIWVNGTGKIYPTVPGFYAVLSSRPLRAITSDETLKTLGIGLNNIDFGRVTKRRSRRGNLSLDRDPTERAAAALPGA